MSIKLSIVIPVYNCEKTIKRTIDSVLPQMNEYVELIIVNDGSTDLSGNIINGFKFSNYNFKLIEKGNEGLIQARYSGIKEANGEYILNVDGGDEIEPNCIDILLDKISSSNDDVFVIGHKTFFDDGAIENELYDGTVIPNVQNLLLGNIPFSICYKVVRKNLYLNCPIFNYSNRISVGEDLCISFDVMVQTNKISYINEYIYKYNREKNSMVSDSKLFFIALDYVKNRIHKSYSEYSQELNALIFNKTIGYLSINKKLPNYSEYINYYNLNNNNENTYIKFKNIKLLLVKLKYLFN